MPKAAAKTPSTKSSKPKKSGDAAPDITSGSPGPTNHATPSPPRSHTFQRFETLTVRRSQLHLHEQNPRSIDKTARRKLREFIRKNGLVAPLTVNRRTTDNGFSAAESGQLTVVSGHQRLSCMDEITGYENSGDSGTAPHNDYDVPISVVEVNAARERELLVALNNPASQGNWDLDLLGECLSFPGIDLKATGFERTDLALILDDGVLDSIFGEVAAAQVAAETPVIDALMDIKQVSKLMQSGEVAGAASPADNATATAGPPSAALTTDSGGTVARPDPNSREALIARRKDYVEKSKDADDADFMLVIVGDNSDQLTRFMSQLELPLTSRYVPLEIFAEKIGVKLA